MMNMKCTKCDNEATYTSPEHYCDEHWARWWGGFDEQNDRSYMMYFNARLSGIQILD